jgi:hypothetical protein
MQDPNKIKELLGTGLSNEVVASAVGCDPSYISQLMSREDFASEVVAMRTASLSANSTRDKNIDKIEDALIEKVQELVDTHQIYKPLDVVRVFAAVNAAKRRGVPAHESLTINQTVVNLTIPESVVKTFTTNTQGEVVDVEGQTLVTMPATQLLRTLVESKGGKNAAYEKIARHLPNATEPAGTS